MLCGRNFWTSADRMRFEPQLACGCARIYARTGPPGHLVATAMDLAMMTATERHRELVAHLAAERTRLRETQMMWVGRRAATDQAGLLHHEAKVLAVAEATRLRVVQFAFVDWRLARLDRLPRAAPRPFTDPLSVLELGKLSLEKVFYKLGVGCHQGAFGTNHPMGPDGRFLGRSKTL
jgi:hypothetical protein